MFICSAAQDSVRLTHEQLRIVKYQAGPSEIIKIVAFAGMCGLLFTFHSSGFKIFC